MKQLFYTCKRCGKTYRTYDNATFVHELSCKLQAHASSSYMSPVPPTHRYPTSSRIATSEYDLEQDTLCKQCINDLLIYPDPTITKTDAFNYANALLEYCNQFRYFDVRNKLNCNSKCAFWNGECQIHIQELRNFIDDYDRS